MDFPLWIYVVIGGILFSAFMVIKTAKVDDDFDIDPGDPFIEQEGQIYIERMKQEKEKRWNEVSNLK